MIKRYILGEPIYTGAVVRDIKAESVLCEIFEFYENGFKFDIDKDDIVYGLGQAVRGLNKRGYIYQSKCSDDPVHIENKYSLYGAHNFFIIYGKKNFGVFVDTPSKVSFDMAFTSTDELKVDLEYSDYNLYIIEASTLTEIVQEFRQLIGKSYMPPKWAFGYGQSRWSYYNSDEVREVVKIHKENDIPLDMVYLDIDYMKDYKDFTINEDLFPDFENFVKEMKTEGIRLIPIIDAGVKIEKGYDVYEEGVANNYFCKKADGSDIICGVWPGEVHFPDFLNSDARKWFGNKYDFLISKGIEGFWNDMNEPAIFYTKDRLESVFDEIDKYRDMNLDIYKFFEFKDTVANLSNNEEDYKTFYHNYDGKKYRHDIVHNLYGYNMTRAAGEYFDSLDKEILMFSRSSYIGAHRYGGIWQGDNCSWWSHIELNMYMTMSLNMAGFLYTGADIGGFGDNCSPDLMLRWLEFGIFTPLMRNHSALGTRRQEVYQFDNMSDMREIIKIRYVLMDYIYNAFKKAVDNNTMYMRPLSFDYSNDIAARRIEDQILVGDSIMIAPVYKQNALGRMVYLPETMKMLKLRSVHDIEEKVLEKGYHYIDVALNEVLIFIRNGETLSLSFDEKYFSSVKDKIIEYSCEV